MNYAVIRVGGKQYFASPNMTLSVDKLEGTAGEKITFEQILLYVNGEEAKLGRPYIEGMTVEAKIIESKKGEKVRVAKYKAKSRYRKVRGFRPQITEIMIESIKEGKKKGVK